MRGAGRGGDVGAVGIDVLVVRPPLRSGGRARGVVRRAGAGLVAAALAAGAVVAFLTLKPTPTPYTTADLLWAGSLMAAVVFAAWLNAARRRAEQMLQERDTRLRLVSEQIPAGLWSTDTDLRLTSRFGSGTFAPQATPGVSLLEVFPGQSSDYPPIAAHLRALRRVEHLRDGLGRPDVPGPRRTAL